MENKECYTVDFKGVNSRYALYERIMEGLDFPDYCGMNLDALWDCLTDMIGHGVEITFENFDCMEKYDKEYAEKLCEILERSKHFAGDMFYDTYKIYVVNAGVKKEIK